MKKLLTVAFVFASIISFGQSGIDNRYVKTDSLYLKTFIGIGVRTLAVNELGTIIEDTVRVAKNDSVTGYVTPAQLNANMPKGAVGTVLIGKGTGVNGEFSSTIEGKLTYSGTNTFSDPKDLISKAYADGIQSGAAVKLAVDVATTGENLDLSGTETIDGISVVTGSRVLVHTQTDSITNGIYDANSAGAWTRAVDTDDTEEIYRGYYVVLSGDSLSGASYVTDIDSAGFVVGSDKIVFNIFNVPSNIVAGDGLIKIGNELDVRVDNSTTQISGDNVIVKDGGITNAKVATGIDAAKLADGTVSNVELQYIGTATSDVQTQINNKISTSQYSASAYNSNTWNGSSLITDQNAIRDQFVADSAWVMGKNYVTNITLGYDGHQLVFKQYRNGVFNSQTPIYNVQSNKDGTMTYELYNKLSGIETGAEVNPTISWNATTGDGQIYDKPDVIVKADTARTAIEHIVTGYELDSTIAAIPAGGTNYWDLDVDTIYPNVDIVKLDTVVMGASSITLPNNAVYGLYSLKYDGTDIEALTNTVRYCFNETGQIQYKITYSGAVFTLYRSTDYGQSFTALRVINYSKSPSRMGLKCSNYGNVVVYTDYSASTNWFHYSSDYGQTFTNNSIGASNISETAALDISDDGVLVAIGTTVAAGQDSVIFTVTA
jgi:hypothetical protein